jgi:hypothetical protein
MKLLRKILPAFFLAISMPVLAVDNSSTAHFLGPNSCSSSGCHGGAGERNQNLIWSKLDFHSRSYATLTSARSERFAEVLKLGDATQSSRCTSCHAPFQTLDEKLKIAGIKATQGVSCESCHGAAEPWLRSHTRPDFSHEDKTAAGLRDLKNLYVRANTCVACHQTLDPELARAGHPELIFELDGQCVSEPRHWTEPKENSGPKIWLVGQAVALREMSWQLSKQTPADENLVARWSGLLWVLQQINVANPSLPALPKISENPTSADFQEVQKSSDQLARQAAQIIWKDESTRELLKNLAETAPQFSAEKSKALFQARRAERLVLALDRLSVSLPANPDLSEKIDALFAETQSIPDFSPGDFSKTLAEVTPLLR